MNYQQMRSLAGDCYAAFNALEAKPRACELWAEMCESVAGESLTWIRGKIIAQDSLPRNFGKAVLGLYAEWRAQTGRGAREQRCCPDCDRQTPGFFASWKNDEETGRLQSYLLRCMCNQDPQWHAHKAMSKGQAQREGYTVMPAGYHGGPAAFERTTFPGVISPETDFGRRASSLASAPYRSDKQRPSHAEQLAMLEAI